MKRIKLLHLSVLFVALTFILTGCASTGFLMAKPKVTMFRNAYPPKNDKANIDVYMTTMPTKKYVELAKITCADTNEKWCLQQISKKAREIGADAVIVVGKAGSLGIGIPMGYSTYVVNEEYGMTVIAIKYKKR